jgi:hypothetical protein
MTKTGVVEDNEQHIRCAFTRPVGAGHAGLDTSKVRPITPGKACPGLYSLSAIFASLLLLSDCLLPDLALAWLGIRRVDAAIARPRARGSRQPARHVCGERPRTLRQTCVEAYRHLVADDAQMADTTVGSRPIWQTFWRQRSKIPSRIYCADRGSCSKLAS